jgi:hypothetical protein
MGKPGSGPAGPPLTREPVELSSDLKVVVADDLRLAKEMAATARQQIAHGNYSKGCIPILLRYCFGIEVRNKKMTPKIPGYINTIESVYHKFILEADSLSFRYDTRALLVGTGDKRAYYRSDRPKTIFLRPAYFGLEDIQIRPEDSQVKMGKSDVRGRALTLIHEFVHSIDPKSKHVEDRDLFTPQQLKFKNKQITPDVALHDVTTYEHFAKWTTAGLTCAGGRIN